MPRFWIDPINVCVKIPEQRCVQWGSDNKRVSFSKSGDFRIRGSKVMWGDTNIASTAAAVPCDAGFSHCRTLTADIWHHAPVILYSVQCCYALHWTDNNLYFNYYTTLHVMLYTQNLSCKPTCEQPSWSNVVSLASQQHCSRFSQKASIQIPSLRSNIQLVPMSITAAHTPRTINTLM